jgi:DNA-directed RNA polymerase alpha subunit
LKIIVLSRNCYEKVDFEIITDGSIHPKHALTEAAKTIDSPLHVIPQTENYP